MSAPRDLHDLRRRVQSEIELEVARQRHVLAELGPDTERLVDAVDSLLRGGKRLRAAFCYWGYAALGGTHHDAALRAATAMEFFQAAALLHDDVMDDSAVRRGAPTAHVVLADEHTARRWSGEAPRFGLAGAILAGDLCLVWTDEVMATSGLPAEEAARGRRCFDEMRTQLMGGQFLDVLDSARGWNGLDTQARIDGARRVIRYKSAKYSVQQPLLIGADTAGVEMRDRELLSRYGLDLGEAFQLRDDVLGVFGDPSATGKPAGDDLREGKRTVLIALTLEHGDAASCARLERDLGRPDVTAAEIDDLRDIIVTSGALDRHELMIQQRTRSAAEALEGVRGLTPKGRAALDELTSLATDRTH